MPRILEATQEPAGSRFFQGRLVEGGADAEEVTKFVEAVLPSTAKLCSDLHGSPVMLKLFERASQDQAIEMARKLKGEVFELSTHRYGCRVIQKVLEVVPEELQVELASELEQRVIECVENMHGNHVVQACAKQLPFPYVKFVLDAMLPKVDEMSEHMYGCRVLQRLVERLPPDDLEPLVEPMVANTAKLAKDKNGNYIIQCILQYGRKEQKQTIIQVIKDGIVEYASDKVASNVVEQCFEVSTIGPDADFLKEDRGDLYSTVLGDGTDVEKAPLQQLMHDRYGNYAVQCIIKHSRGEDREILQERITSAEAKLNETATGKHVIAALKKATGELPEDPKDESVPDAPSKGSVLHASGQCQPCAWFWKPMGCRNDQNCQRCHLCPEGELKERKKQKRHNRNKAPDGAEEKPGQ